MKAERRSCRACSTRSCLFLWLSRRELSFHSEDFTRTLRYEPGSLIFQEDEAPCGYYLICQGAVKLTRRTPSGKRILLDILGPGDVLGLERFAQAQPYRVYAQALEPVQVGFVNHSDLKRLIRRYPHLALELLKKLSGEVGRWQERFASVAHRPARERLAWVLLSLAERFGHAHTQDGKVRIALSLTRVDLADMAGVTRETASVTLKRLERQGLIRTNGSQIQIRDRRGLAALV